MNKKLYQYILTFTGLLMFSGFIWLRFIRERLPKNIPFNLSILGFCLLLTTCSIFLYIIISLLRTNKPVDPLIKQVVDSIYIPLKTLDHYIKNTAYANNTYKHGINFLAYILESLIINSKIYYYIFAIMPRVILLTVLHIDVFYFNKLVYIYKFLLIGLVILIGKYIIYSFKYAKEHFIEEFQHYVSITMSYEHASQLVELDLDDEEDDDVPPTMVIPLSIFVEYQTNAFIQQGHYCDYMPYMRNPISLYYKEHNIIVSRIFTYEEVTDRVKNILRISLILIHYEFLQSDPDIRNLKILIYINYLLCWSYILIISIPSLYNTSFWELWFIFNLQDIEDPFSGTILA
jgi:hypothetical protein